MIEDHKGDPMWPQKYTFEQICELRDKVSLITIARKYGTFNRVDSDDNAVKYLGLCLYEPDATKPYMTVDETKQLYHCFNCGNGGDIFSLVMDMEKVSFDEAFEIIEKGAK